MPSRWRLLRSPLRSFGALLALAALSLASLTSSAARAQLLDPSMPREVALGAPPGYAPMDRLDPKRSGVSRAQLPQVLNEVWRRHVSGGIGVPPLVDETGAIYVALTTPEIIKLGPDSREQWRVRIGSSAAAAPITFLADGTLVAITRAGQAFGVTHGGALRFVTWLGVSGRDVELAPAPLALSNGGVAIAVGSTLLTLDADGAVRSRGTLDDHGPLLPASPERASGALLETTAGVVVTTESGGIYRFRAPAPPRRLGSFGGSVRRGATLEGDRTLLAVVDNRRLVAFDLVTGQPVARANAAPGLFDAPSASLGGLTYYVTQVGSLYSLDAAGVERPRAALEKPALGAAGPVGGFGGGFGGPGFFATVELKPSPPIILDPQGRVGFLRANGRAGVVLPDGRVVVASERVCSAPIALQPAGEKRMVVACADGGLWMYGE